MARLIHGQKVVAATAAQITANSQKVESLVLKAHSGNGSDVFFGDSTVTTSTGYPLSPGEEFRFDPANDNLKLTPLPSDIYVIGTAGDDISWIATPR